MSQVPTHYCMSSWVLNVKKIAPFIFVDTNISEYDAWISVQFQYVLDFVVILYFIIVSLGPIRKYILENCLSRLRYKIKEYCKNYFNFGEKDTDCKIWHPTMFWHKVTLIDLVSTECQSLSCTNQICQKASIQQIKKSMHFDIHKFSQNFHPMAIFM